MTYKRAFFIALVACAWLLYRECKRPRPAKPQPPTIAECEPILLGDPSITITRSDDSRSAGTNPALPERGGGFTAYGFHVPAWALRLAPQPGENLLAYRDRVLPLAQAALAPQRARVARGRDDFAEAVGLDDRQRAELDTAVQDAASQIQERVLEAAFNGDFAPASFKPMTAVKLGRDVLDAVDRANLRFLSVLHPAQREKLASHPFDIADYLVFSTRWEDALGFSGR